MSNRREKNKPQNTLNKQLEPAMEKTKNECQIQFGKFLYSLAGLTYAGAVLTVFVDYDESKNNILLLGLVAMFLQGIFAWILVKRGNVKKVRL